MKFFRFRQNNSGGHFHYDPDKGLSVEVYVEADNAEHANDRAESIGIYFDGCDDGYDCPCCGDRWYRSWEEPEDVDNAAWLTYGLLDKATHKFRSVSIADAVDELGWIDGFQVFVHFKDGTFKGYVPLK